MSVATNEITAIPAAIPFAENEEEREKLLKQAADENSSDDASAAEIEEEELDETIQAVKTPKKKLFLAFVGFVFGFVLLFVILSWFFGIGIFAQTKTQAVDRTAKNNSSASTAPVTEDEKLKMALNLVAEKNPNVSKDAMVNPDSVTNLNNDSSGTIPPVKAADLTEPVVVPDALSNPNSVSSTNPTIYPVRTNQAQNSSVTENNQNLTTSAKTNLLDLQPNRSENTPLGRSLFFGIERKNNSEQNSSSPVNTQIVSSNQTLDFTNAATQPAIPFGTLLPIRFLGAVYTLRASGGLVRMELTRGVSGKNYSYPAGTVLVGTLRGSEYKRAFVSVVGLIDLKTGGLVKFEGEAMGNDGASGVVGRRRQVKGAWSRIFGGLREAGSVALGAVVNGRRSGGTVVISDSTAKASGMLSDELSGLIGNRSSGEFVEVPAGTTGFVLVTDLPDEVSVADSLAKNSKAATGLSENELAELFSSGSKEKIRAALPRMTPAFRKLAETALSAMDGE
jgi:hypothetical protein